jgi:hypothetical protein
MIGKINLIFIALNCRSRREEALTFRENDESLLTSAPTRFMEKSDLGFMGIFLQ